MQLGYDREGKKEKHYRHLLHENNQLFKKLMKKKDPFSTDFHVIAHDL